MSSMKGGEMLSLLWLTAGEAALFVVLVPLKTWLGIAFGHGDQMAP
jgi:hypothetical protein